MLGEKIKKLRTTNSLTQKDLAEKLFVTAQAVSRWENNEVEPSIASLTEMAKIFNVSVSELLEEEQKHEIVAKEEPAVPKQTERVVLAVCENCNKPIYNAMDIVRNTEYYGESAVKKVICKSCDKKQKEEAHKRKVYSGLEQRKKSFKWGSVFAGLITLALVIITIALKLDAWIVLLSAGVGVSSFPFLSCLYLKNNFIGDVVEEVASWSIRFPGLIFTLDLDGIIWFITVKLIFGVISFLLSVACIILAVALGWFLSLFVYPFAIVKNIKYPELTEF